MMVKSWKIRVQIPQCNIDDTSNWSGSYPWTALNRATEWALKCIAKNLKMVYSYNEGDKEKHLADPDPVAGAALWDFRLIKQADQIQQFTVTFIERVKPVRAKPKSKARPDMVPAPTPGEAFGAVFR